MKKKSADQKGEAGRLATAVGYTTKARPAPGGGTGHINIHMYISVISSTQITAKMYDILPVLLGSYICRPLIDRVLRCLFIHSGTIVKEV